MFQPAHSRIFSVFSLPPNVLERNCRPHKKYSAEDGRWNTPSVTTKWQTREVCVVFECWRNSFSAFALFPISRTIFSLNLLEQIWTECVCVCLACVKMMFLCQHTPNERRGRKNSSLYFISIGCVWTFRYLLRLPFCVWVRCVCFVVFCCLSNFDAFLSC